MWVGGSLVLAAASASRLSGGAKPVKCLSGGAKKLPNPKQRCATLIFFLTSAHPTHQQR